MKIDPFTTADRDAQNREIAWKHIDQCKTRIERLELLKRWVDALVRESRQLEKRSVAAMEDATGSRARATTANAKHEASAEQVQRLEIFITELAQALGFRDQSF